MGAETVRRTEQPRTRAVERGQQHDLPAGALEATSQLERGQGPEAIAGERDGTVRSYRQHLRFVEGGQLFDAARDQCFARTRADGLQREHALSRTQLTVELAVLYLINAEYGDQHQG